MPLRNRVMPTGEIVAAPQRGLFCGNRGIIHDPATKMLLKRRWSSQAWIICLCEFKGRRREVMATRSWTELFFLDEATALAAGHRPCFYCRREEARAFADAWAKGNDLARVSAKQIDATLHHERLDGKTKQRHPLPCAIADLPDGAMVQAEAACYLIVKDGPLRWSFDGYQAEQRPLRDVSLLTPPSTLRALSAGYRPVLHPNATIA